MVHRVRAPHGKPQLRRRICRVMHPARSGTGGYAAWRLKKSPTARQCSSVPSKIVEWFEPRTT